MNTDKPCDGFEICGNWVPDHEYWCRKCKANNSQQAELERKAAAYDELKSENESYATLVDAMTQDIDDYQQRMAAIELERDQLAARNARLKQIGGYMLFKHVGLRDYAYCAERLTEHPAASIAEIEARPLELLRKNLLSDIPSSAALDHVIRYVDSQLETIRNQHKEEN